MRTGCLAASTSSSLVTGVVTGASCSFAGSVFASSYRLRNTWMASSSVSFDSVSVGYTMRASSTIRGKYIVGGWMPLSSSPLAMSMAEMPVPFFRSARLMTNSCMQVSS